MEDKLKIEGFMKAVSLSVICNADTEDLTRELESRRPCDKCVYDGRGKCLCVWDLGTVVTSFKPFDTPPQSAHGRGEEGEIV